MSWIDKNKQKDPHAKVGMRVRLVKMYDDYNPIDEGLEGTIYKIDSLGTLHVKWDDGRLLGLIPNEDEYDLLPPLEDQIGYDDLKNVFKENKKQPLSTKVSNDFKSEVNKSKLNIRTENSKKKVNNIKDEVERIVNTINTSKPIHRTSLENMVKNLINKYKGVKKNEEKFSELITRLYQKIEDKFGLDETTTTVSAMGSTPIQPLGSTIHKNPTKNNKTKGDLKNPTGVKYDIKEETSLKSLNKNREDSTFDRPTWADKKTWIKLKNLAWKDGEIIDVSKYLDVDSKDPVVIKNKKKLKESKKDVTKSEDDDNIEETTTMSSVFNGNFPVTPYMFAKKGKHKPSKKTLWKGGKIVQKVDRADLLGEDILKELNKVKWVKNGKFVKIKDRCAKYNNQPHCSQGAIDDPLIFSEETINNIKKVSEDYGVDFNHLINLVREKVV